MSDQKPNVLVVCTGNSCRSQMAEAYLRFFSGDRLEVASAGTEPVDEIHPLALRVLREDGLDLTGRKPQDYRRFLTGSTIDYLIVVCDGAAKACPAAWPGVEQRLSWPFDDPAAFVGSEEETLAEFRRVRDEIRDRIRQWLSGLPDSTPTREAAEAP